jgi:hypothetical protein
MNPNHQPQAVEDDVGAVVVPGGEDNEEEDLEENEPMMESGDNAPNPPPFPPTLAEAIAALVNATTLLAQNQNGNQGRRGRNNGGETTYVDFTDTRPPVFSKAEEPLEADD